jgi:hypothetical protein
MPADAGEGGVGERVAEGRELPVEHGDDAGLGRMKHQVAEPEIAVADRGLVVGRHVGGKPLDQAVDLGDLAGARELPLLRPAPELAGEVGAGPAVIGKAETGPIGRVQLRHGLGHGEVHGPPLLGLDARQRVVVEDAALDALHDVEGRADHVALGLEKQGRRHRHVGLRKRPHDPELAVDGMGGGQDLARRLLAQHETAVVEGDEEGRVRLPARDAGQPHGAAQARQRLAEEGVKAGRVKLRRVRRGRSVRHGRLRRQSGLRLRRRAR